MPTVTRCALDRDTNPHTVDERNRGTSQLKYLIDTDGAMASNAVLNAALAVGPNPLPSLWSQFSYLGHTITTIFARRYQCNRDPRHLNRYEALVDFWALEPGHDPNSGTPGFADVDPLLRPPVVLWDSEVYTYRTDFDQAGTPILNKALIRYEDPVEEEESRGVLVVQFNVATFSNVVTHNRTFELTTNSIDWDVKGDASLVVAAREAFCRRVGSQLLTTEGGTSYFTEEYRIAFKKSGQKWDRRFKEHGFLHYHKDPTATHIDGDNYVLDSAGGRKLRGSLSETGVFRPNIPYAEPVLLASDGTRLTEAGTPVYTDWRVKREADFNNMPFMPLVFT